MNGFRKILAGHLYENIRDEIVTFLLVRCLCICLHHCTYTALLEKKTMYDGHRLMDDSCYGNSSSIRLC